MVCIFVLIQKQFHFCRGKGSDIHHQLRLYTNGKFCQGHSALVHRCTTKKSKTVPVAHIIWHLNTYMKYTVNILCRFQFSCIVSIKSDNIPIFTISFILYFPRFDLIRYCKLLPTRNNSGSISIQWIILASCYIVVYFIDQTQLGILFKGTLKIYAWYTARNKQL